MLDIVLSELFIRSIWLLLVSPEWLLRSSSVPIRAIMPSVFSVSVAANFNSHSFCWSSSRLFISSMLAFRRSSASCNFFSASVAFSVIATSLCCASLAPSSACLRASCSMVSNRWTLSTSNAKDIRISFSFSARSFSSLAGWSSSSSPFSSRHTCLASRALFALSASSRPSMCNRSCSFSSALSAVRLSSARTWRSFSASVLRRLSSCRGCSASRDATACWSSWRSPFMTSARNVCSLMALSMDTFRSCSACICRSCSELKSLWSDTCPKARAKVMIRSPTKR
mmetsp:Transcript_17528/g.61264  ORF Transcript_17528/g.61264 Transcript_17528/m.61264 type:complete len:283 (-) Transcript_17528:1752-2600(-)